MFESRNKQTPKGKSERSIQFGFDTDQQIFKKNVKAFKILKLKDFDGKIQIIDTNTVSHQSFKAQTISTQASTQQQPKFFKILRQSLNTQNSEIQTGNPQRPFTQTQNVRMRNSSQDFKNTLEFDLRGMSQQMRMTETRQHSREEYKRLITTPVGGEYSHPFINQKAQIIQQTTNDNTYKNAQTAINQINQRGRQSSKNLNGGHSSSQRIMFHSQDKRQNPFHAEKDFNMESEFLFLDIKSNLDTAGKKMKYMTHLEQEFEILNFQMFFGVSNDEIKNSQGMNSPSSDMFGTSKTGTPNSFIKFDKSGTRVKGPSSIRSLFHDTNELFLKLQKGDEMNFGRSEFDYHYQRQIEADILDIQRRYRRYVQYIIKESGFMSAVVIDMLWKSLMLKVDQYLMLMNTQTTREKDKQSKEFLRNLEEKQLREKEIEQEIQETTMRYELQIKHMNQQIKDLSQQRFVAEKQLEDFKQELESLEQGENRRSTLNHFGEVCSNINLFINKVQSEQRLSKNDLGIQTEFTQIKGSKVGKIMFNPHKQSNIASILNSVTVYAKTKSSPQCILMKQLLRFISDEKKLDSKYIEMSSNNGLVYNTLNNMKNFEEKLAIVNLQKTRKIEFKKLFQIFSTYYKDAKYYQKFQTNMLFDGADGILNHQSHTAYLTKQGLSDFKIRSLLENLKDEFINSSTLQFLCQWQMQTLKEQICVKNLEILIMTIDLKSQPSNFKNNLVALFEEPPYSMVVVSFLHMISIINRHLHHLPCRHHPWCLVDQHRFNCNSSRDSDPGRASDYNSQLGHARVRQCSVMKNSVEFMVVKNLLGQGPGKIWLEFLWSLQVQVQNPYQSQGIQLKTQQDVKISKEINQNSGFIKPGGPIKVKFVKNQSLEPGLRPNSWVNLGAIFNTLEPGLAGPSVSTITPQPPTSTVPGHLTQPFWPQSYRMIWNSPGIDHHLLYFFYKINITHYPFLGRFKPPIIYTHIPHGSAHNYHRLSQYHCWWFMRQGVIIADFLRPWLPGSAQVWLPSSVQMAPKFGVQNELPTLTGIGRVQIINQKLWTTGVGELRCRQVWTNLALKFDLTFDFSGPPGPNNLMIQRCCQHQLVVNSNQLYLVVRHLYGCKKLQFRFVEMTEQGGSRHQKCLNC
ncbi:UNKNOWN [Stylonychia lemnae]|uniref:Uncharacterized protein n=1 Tax=Stylonychia lemnae TaxID=5949 RepID=A0A078BCG7_STYLE|nr:UNKNOWN [Stylonychia lemnae]|eukprot:CDW90897.1 UNKNOWN [Stylonychia lemnae]